MITAEQIHNELYDLGLKRLSDLKGTRVDKSILKKRDQLLKLGLTNSKTYCEVEEASRKMQEAEAYDFFNSRFDGVIFVPIKDFVDLLIKYDLYCGTLEDFSGEIPDENIDEILDAKNTLDSIVEENKYSNANRSIITSIRSSSLGTTCNTILLDQLKEEVHSYDGALPRTMSEIEYLLEEGWGFLITDLSRWGLNFRVPSSDPLRILRSIESSQFTVEVSWRYETSINKMAHFPIYGANKNDSGVTSQPLAPNTLLIAAPRGEMNRIIELEEAPIYVKDPFVFQVLEKDVVIYSKWGVEAKDELFDKL